VVVSKAGGVRSWGRAVEPSLRTVDMLFSQADRVIRSNAEEVAVEFNDRLGYPTRIRVDYRGDMEDDERTWVAVIKVLD
jgi:hypothetical protein